jgi:2-(1,2-epoxy-1,2-dihydrophenyl)acetyl-CoA isomerase
MSFTELNYAVDGPVAVIALNRPDALNAFTKVLRNELPTAFAKAEADAAVRAVVLTGEGRGFSAGADLKEGGLGDDVTDILMKEYKPGLDAIANSAKPYIAAINGPCAGIGAAYALTCDLAVMEEDSYIYMAFAAIGLIPDGGNHWHLVQSLGYKRAYAAIVGASKLPAADCLAAGMVNRVVPTGTARAEAVAWAKQLATGAPRTLRYAKQVLRQAVSGTLDETIALESVLQAECTTSHDAANAVRSFLKKEKPVFTGA